MPPDQQIEGDNVLSDVVVMANGNPTPGSRAKPTVSLFFTYNNKFYQLKDVWTISNLPNGTYAQETVDYRPEYLGEIVNRVNEKTRERKSKFTGKSPSILQYPNTIKIKALENLLKKRLQDHQGNQ